MGANSCPQLAARLGNNTTISSKLQDTVNSALQFCSAEQGHSDGRLEARGKDAYGNSHVVTVDTSGHIYYQKICGRGNQLIPVTSWEKNRAGGRPVQIVTYEIPPQCTNSNRVLVGVVDVEENVKLGIILLAIPQIMFMGPLSIMARTFSVL